MKKSFLIILLFFSSPLIAQIDQNVSYKVGLAENYEQAGQFDKAEILYKELLQIQPSMVQFFESLNRAYVVQKKYTQSVNLIESRIKDNPQDPSLYGLLGTTYFIMDSTARAYEIWEKGLAANSNAIVAYRVIANAAIENRAYDKAIDILQRGKKLSKDDYLFTMDLANIHALNMNYGKAVTELCGLVESRPEQVNLVKARVASFVTRPLAIQQSIDAIKNYVEQKPTVELYDLLAFTYQQTGDFENSFETIKKSEEDFKGNGTSMLIFAQTVFQMQQYKYAALGYKFIIDNYPKSDYLLVSKISYAKALEESLNQKSDSLFQTWKPIPAYRKVFIEDYQKIIVAYDNFIKTSPLNAYHGEAFFRLAEIYRTRLDQLEIADSMYQKVIRNFPQISQATNSKLALGKIALSKNKLEEAKRYFGEVAQGQTDPNLISEAQFYLAKIEFWKGNFSIAAEKFREATKTFSNDFSNDALELNFLINTVKNDSLNLLRYASADFFMLQNNLKQAAVEFKTLADNDNLFILNQFAKIRMAEIFISEDNFFSATQELEKLQNNSDSAIFAEKCAFLLGMTYHYGIGDLKKAEETFQKILEKFPNSIYFDHARDEIKGIQTKNGQK